MTTSKLSPAKDIMAQKRQKKLAAALRTNLRRRKDQARDRAETGDAEIGQVETGEEGDGPVAAEVGAGITPQG